VRVEFLEKFAFFDGAEGVSTEIVLNTDSSTGQTLRTVDTMTTFPSLGMRLVHFTRLGLDVRMEYCHSCMNNAECIIQPQQLLQL